MSVAPFGLLALALCSVSVAAGLLLPAGWSMSLPSGAD